MLLLRKWRFKKKSKSIFTFTADLQPNHTAESDFSLAARKTSFLATLGDRSLKVIRFSLHQDQGPNAQGPFLIKVKACQQPHIYKWYLGNESLVVKNCACAVIPDVLTSFLANFFFLFFRGSFPLKRDFLLFLRKLRKFKPNFVLMSAIYKDKNGCTYNIFSLTTLATVAV